VIQHVCTLSGSLTFLDDIVAGSRRAGITAAIKRRDNAQIFDWLLDTFTYQGISDRVARDYLARHGNARWHQIEAALGREPACRKLRNYWRYNDCRYDKSSFTCDQPDHIDACPLPRHHLRNGRLNQMAYSFFLFVRDIAKGDLIGWIDEQLTGHNSEPDASEAIIGPLRHVNGLSDKILTMALSQLLLTAPQNRPQWFEVGKSMIAIDTLVHNFLHRTGVLGGLGTPHTYGAACYAPGHCADIVRSASRQIDARQFNGSFPSDFPRFVQHAIWRYCAADGLDLCNGNRIDDSKSCQIGYCHIFKICAKQALKSQ
jgi:hypothetical protein